MALPSIQLIIGPRGLGKTSIFHYIKWKAEEIPNFLPIYIDASYESTKYDNPSLIIGQFILANLLEELFNYLFLNNKEIWNNYKQSLDGYMNNIGYIMDHSGVLKNPSSSSLDIHFVNLKRITENMLKICQANNIRLLILIDNIDKGALEPALTFFRESISQSLFEKFITYNSIVIISGKNELRDEMFSGKYSTENSYLQDSIILNNLTPLESYKIIEKRFNSSCKTPVQFPLESEVVHDLWINNKGITRDILINTKIVLEKAFKFKEKLITYKLYKSRKFNSKENSEVFTKILEGDIPSLKGSEALMGLYTVLNCNSNKFRSCVKLLINIFNGKKLSKEDNIFLSELVDNKFLSIDLITHNFLLREDIKYFFNKLIQNDMDLSEFMEWFINDHLEEISIDTNKILPEDKLSEFKEQSLKHKWDKVTISYPDRYHSFSETELPIKVDIFFQSALKSFSRLNSEDWDEIENEQIFNEMWNIVFNLCKAITYLLSSYYIEDIQYGFPDRKNDWDNIYYFIIQKGQNTFKYLETFEYIKNLYSNRKKIVFEKSIEPSKEDLMKWYSKIDDIIEDLYGMWVLILSEMAKTKSSETVKKSIDMQMILTPTPKEKPIEKTEEKLNIIRDKGTNIVNLRKNCNDSVKFCGKEPIFKPTNKTEIISSELPRLLCSTEAEFKQFIENLYLYIIESSGNGKRLQNYINADIYKSIKELRNHFEHDRDHGDSKDVMKKYEKVGDIYFSLIGVKLPKGENWVELQISLMDKLIDLLNQISSEKNL